MSAENVKWAVNRGVQASNLVPAARLIMFVLSDMADAKTGMIPIKHSPSLADLARKTGLGKSTIADQLADLEELGWVHRSRPSGDERARHQPTYYQVMVGSPGKERSPLKRKPRVKKKPPEEGSAVQELDIVDVQEKDTGDVQELDSADVQELDPEEFDVQELADQCPGASDSMSRSKTSYIKDYDLNDHTINMSADADATPPKAAKPKAKPKAVPSPPRDDVMRVCNHLADRIQANGSKRPDFGKGWLDAARLMLDRDGPDSTGIPEADIHAGIDWCQDSEFWRGNVMSLPKFREKYDQMRLQAQRSAPGRRPSAMQQRIDEGLERQERMRLLDEAEARGENVSSSLFSALPPGTLGGLT